LEALKLLQESYLGKVKMIYIDPPYNTGNDFVYNDDFAEDTDEYLVQSLQKDEEGNRLVANPESRGRYHSDWLSMMHSRLRLARNLLRDDGVIFISIDDHEQANLLRLCEEIFGENNYSGTFVWERKKKPSFLKKTMGTVTEYVHTFAKQYESVDSFISGYAEDGKMYPFNNAGNNYSRLVFPERTVRFNMKDQLVRSQDMSAGNIKTKLISDVLIKDGLNETELVLDGEWRYSQDRVNELIESGNEIRISQIPFRPNLINRELRTKKTANFLSYRLGNVSANEDATSEIREIFGGNSIMEYTKPRDFIQYLINTSTFTGEGIILDFFAGSSTTAHAVMQLNAEDGGNRKFIMVQLPEETDEKSEAYKAGYKNIAEISKERIRRAGKQILESDDIHEDWNRDIGFRVLKIDSSNMKETFYKPEELTQGDLLAQIENVKEDRTAEDLLFQIMLDWGLPLDLPIEVETIQNKTVYIVAEDALIACFDEGIDEAIVKTLADRKPLRLLFRDNYYASNAVKINAEQLIKQLSPNTELKSI
ncbi:MAG: site-specific DNA-methyltransferase, partial [Xanthomonadaceae bacterium]|nr:site-specific DNA-methyltransferase [Xanthomonadaceae bacterium]